MQSRGSLAETSLRNLLEAAQGERSTGTLTVRNGSGKSASLYVLFGHLFHAQSDGMAGDAAVVSALGWGGGEFEFDAKAKLPSDETVKAGIPELVQAAESGSEEVPEQPAPPPPDASDERRDHPVAEKKVEAPQPRRGVKHRPQPKHGREPIPVPAGQVIYDSLKTSFVDFPRLITTLEKESYTGYVRLLTEEASGLILFREGQALECMYDAGDDQQQGLILGKQALQRFNEDVTNGHGVLDVVGLSAELIEGLYELTVSRPMYTELYASWVDMKALLKFLNDRKLSGSVMIRSGAGTGVIILAEGELAGAYTSESRDISDKPDRALALCEDPNAMIEVKSADTSTHTPLDIDEVVAGQRGPRMNTQVAQTTPPTPAPPAPPPPAEPATSQIPVVAQTATYPSMQREAPTPPSMPAMPMQQAPTAPPAPSGPQLDWAAIVAELQAMAEDQLGNRARKVKDILGAADPSIAGIEAAIDQVPSISLLFVDSSRLEQLAQEMRARLKSHYERLGGGIGSSHDYVTGTPADEAPYRVLSHALMTMLRKRLAALATATLVLAPLSACGGAPAQIVDYSPLRGAKDVSTLAPVQLTFDHDVNRASVESRLHLVPAVNGGVRWRNGHQLEYQHEKLATATTYDVVLEAGYSDLAGNVYELRHHWSFDTEVPPQFAGSTPSDGDSAVDPADYVSVTFSRAMLESSLASAIVFTPDVRFGVRIDPSDSRRVIVAPDSLLQPNTMYRMLVTQIAKDTDGNELDHVRSISFTTGAARPLHHWVAFAAKNSAGTSGGLWIVNETGIPRQLLESSAVNAYSWSPDGQRLIFETADGWATFAPGEGTQSLGFSAIWAAALAPGLGYAYLDSAGSLYLAPRSGADYVVGTLVTTVAVSPSGERLVFGQDQLDGTTRIWGYDVGLRSRYALASEATSVSDLSWAPNGNRIAYLRHDAGTVTLRVRNLTGSGAITTVVQGDISAPAWLHDSNHMVMAASVIGDSGPVGKAFVINVASPPPALTIGLGLPALPDVVDVSDPVPSPDGHQIAFISGNQVWLMNADGTRPTALTRFDPKTFPYSCLMPAWTRL